ncbi:MAG: S8 family serine peptidase [Nitrososphaerota archaeon]
MKKVYVMGVGSFLLIVLLFTSTLLTFVTPTSSLVIDESKDFAKRLPRISPSIEEKIKERAEPILKTIEEIKTGANYVKGERIIVFKPTLTREKADEIVRKVKPLSVKDVAILGRKGEEKIVKLLKFEDEEKAKQAEVELKKNQNVLYVARNFKVKAPPIRHEAFRGKPEVSPKAPTADPFRSYQWYLFKTKEDLAPIASTAPTVAVIDTGVQYDHEELIGKVILGYDYVDGDYDPYDEYGHGTAVAGIIAAKVNNAKGIAGISPRSMIYAIRVLDENGEGTFDDVMSGLIEACSVDSVKIINLSLGGYVDYESDEYLTFEDIIDWCVDQGKIVVSAAGNEDNLITYYYDDPFTPYYDLVPVPAAIPSSFTVAATDETDARTYFSNYGTNTLNYVDIAAPGFRILTLGIYNAYYVWYGGTSFSAPIVAAAAARVWGKNPTWNNLQVMDQLVFTGRLLGPEKGFPKPVPRVDIARALGITLTGIQGQIIDAENSDWFYDTLGGAKVKATTIKYAFSNNGGFYTITGLAPGTYTLTVTKKGYVTQTRTVTVTAGQITEDVDFYMAKVKPTTYLTVVTTWNQYNPGWIEWAVSSQWCNYFGEICALEHPDFPRVEDVAGRDMDINLHVLPDDVRIHPFLNLGDLDNPPYAKIVVDSLYDVERPVDTLVYRPLSGKTYNFGVQMPPSAHWGKLVGSGAVTRIFKGSSVTSTISSATATGTADFWWHVYKQSGTGSPSTVNKRVPIFGFKPASGATIILVDDDGSGALGWPDYSEWFTAALTDAGYSFAYWDVFEAGPPSPGDLAPYAITIWFTGDDASTTLTRYERSTLSSYLGAGKKLFITGQEIGWYLNEFVMYSYWAPSFDAILWYNNFLKADYLFDDITSEQDDDDYYGVLALAGVPNDPVSDPVGPPDGNEMMLVIWDGDGADNQYFADGILPIGGSTAIFNYLDEEGDLFTLGGDPIAGGIRFPSAMPAPSTPYRLVYLSFGFEAISDAGTRAQLIDEIITFLNTGS